MESREELVARGLKHVASHARVDDPNDIITTANMIAEGKGSRRNCIMLLSGLYTAKSSYAWFGQNDLIACKQHAYTASKLHYIRIKEFGVDGFVRIDDLFWVLLSDYSVLIDWFATVEPNDYWAKYLKKPNHYLFGHYQLSLALRGDWSLLRQRAEQHLEADPPKLKKYMVDQRFYIALANGDIAGMHEALTELTSPKMARLRNDEMGFAFTAPFIGTHATAYAKIAWRHGYQVKIDTPYIPAEWLPVQPLAKYEDPYPFMREYEL